MPSATNGTLERTESTGINAQVATPSCKTLTISTNGFPSVCMTN